MSLPDDMIENFTYDELKIGQSAQIVRTLTQQDIAAFAAVSGDTNPAHLDPHYASHTLFHGVIGHGMWCGALISTVLGTVFPGPGTIYIDQSMQFRHPVRIGDTLTVRVCVQEKAADQQRITLACSIVNQEQITVVEGIAHVLAPTQKLRLPRHEAPSVRVFEPERRLQDLLDQGQDLSPVSCAVVHACDEDSLRGALEAAQLGLITPVFFAPEARLRGLAEQLKLDLSRWTLIDTPHSHASAQMAAEYTASGQAESLMKGSLHTDELMQAILTQTPLRTKRRMSHLFRFDVPMYDKPLFITDAALNIHPQLLEKADIVQNAIDAVRIFGLDSPKVAILSAVETINPALTSTLDAAALCKMAERGQIHGGQLDGPLAFDNAISPEAARIKGLRSVVAGQADILVVPDLESGNMLAKQLRYMAGASGAGLVLGARVPIALTSRADGPRARIASALLMKLLAHHYRQHRP